MDSTMAIWILFYGAIISFLYFFKGVAYAEKYKHRPQWTLDQIIAYLLGPITLFVIEHFVLLIPVPFSIAVRVLGLFFVIFSGGPSETPDILSSCLHGYFGGQFWGWLGFTLGYQRELNRLKDRANWAQQPHSKAEELAHLKELLQDGSLSPREYLDKKNEVISRAA